MIPLFENLVRVAMNYEDLAHHEVAARQYRLAAAHAPSIDARIDCIAKAREQDQKLAERAKRHTQYSVVVADFFLPRPEQLYEVDDSPW